METTKHFTYKNEILRKLIHVSSLIYPLIYIFTNKTTVSLALCCVLFIVIIWETLRIKGYKIIFLNIINKTLRQNEIKNKNISGAIPFLLSSLLVIVVFSKDIAILSILILIFCDTTAAIIGKKVPIIFFTKLQKSLGGFIAYLTTGAIIVLIYKTTTQSYFSQSIAFFAVFCSAIAEMLSCKIKLDDNFSITIVFATVMQVLSQ